MKRRGWAKGIGVVVAAFLIGVAGCDSPIDPADHVSGAVFLRADGTEAARYVYDDIVTGQLQVPVGGTTTYRVRALTEGGQIVDFDGVRYSIQVPSVVIGVLASIELQGHDELVLTGLMAGQTTVQFQLHHGEHEEFLVDQVPLLVQ